MHPALVRAGTLAITTVLMVAAGLAAPPGGDGPAPHPAHDLPYEIVDGLAVYDGDIVLGTAEELSAISKASTEGGRFRRTRRDLALVHHEFGLWPDGRVPYVIDDELSEGAAENVRAAIDDWNAKTVISLAPRTDETDFVRFVPSEGCRATIGRVGGEQFVWAGGEGTCRGKASIIHEIGHAIGLAHEHQREDRDSRLVVGETTLHGPGGDRIAAVRRDRGPYDYRSAMHYSKREFETIPPGIEIPSAGLSSGDIDGVRRLYGLPPTAITIATNPPGLEIVVDGIVTTAPAEFDWAKGTVHSVEVRTEPQEQQGSRYLFGRWNDGAPRVRTVAAGEAGTWLEANFIVQRRVEIVPEEGEGGVVSVRPASDGWHTLGSKVQFEAVAPQGRRFMNWSWAVNHGPAENPATRTVRGEPISVTAYFTRRGALRVGAEAGVFVFDLDGERRLGPLALDVPQEGRSFDIRIAEIQRVIGHQGSRLRFKGWSDGVKAREREVTVGPEGDALDAIFMAEHALEIATRPPEGGSVSAEPALPDGYYPDGTRVTVTASPGAGWEFARWTGDTEGDGPASISMERRMAIDAWFTQTERLRPGADRQVLAESDAHGFRFAANGSAELVIEFVGAAGSVDTDLYVRAIRSPLEVGTRAWDRLHAVKGRDATDRRAEADFASEAAGGSRRIAISYSTDPPLDPEALYFVVLATEGAAPSGTLRLEASGSGPKPPSGRAWPRAFTFVSDVGTDPSEQVFELRNDGESAMQFDASSESAWLAADPPQGAIAPGESAELAIQVTGLVAADTHEGTLAIGLSGPNGPVSPLALPVTFVAVPPPEGDSGDPAATN